jgi:hypothetical protein
VLGSGDVVVEDLHADVADLFADEDTPAPEPEEAAVPASAAAAEPAAPSSQ